MGPLRILLPVDFSNRDINGLKIALQISRLVPIHITLLNCVPELYDVSEKNALQNRSISTLQFQLDRLKRFLLRYAQIERMQLQVRILTTYGEPEDIIPRTAPRGSFDLLVMTTSAPGNIWKEITGSTSRDVIDKIEIPVLSIPQNHPLSFAHQPPIAFLIDLDHIDYQAFHILTSFTSILTSKLHCLSYHNHPPKPDQWDKLLQLEKYAHETYPNQRFAFALLHGDTFSESIHNYIKNNNIKIAAISNRYKLGHWVLRPFYPKLNNLYFQSLPMFILPQ